MLRPLYLMPNAVNEAVRRGYSQAEQAMVREFAERGYIVLDLDLPDELTQRTIAEVAPEYQGKYATGPGRVMDAPQPSVREIAANPQVLRTLELLHGRPAFPFQTLNFDRGTEQATHSDTIHFDSSPPGFMAGVWVALEDVHADNGPLHYYPGSHRLPHLTLSDFGSRSGYKLYEPVYEPGIRRVVEEHGLKKEEAFLRRGQALIWSANLLHGGSPIRKAGSTRHSQVTHYYFNDCAYFTPMMSDPILGQIFLRSPRDIRTGKKVRPKHHGMRVPAFRSRVAYALRLFLHR